METFGCTELCNHRHPAASEHSSGPLTPPNKPCVHSHFLRPSSRRPCTLCRYADTTAVICAQHPVLPRPTPRGRRGISACQPVCAELAAKRRMQRMCRSSSPAALSRSFYFSHQLSPFSFWEVAGRAEFSHEHGEGRHRGPWLRHSAPNSCGIDLHSQPTHGLCNGV